MMRILSLITVIVLVDVGLTQSDSDVRFDLVLQHIDLLKIQVSLLRSHCQWTSQSAGLPRDCADIQAQGRTSSGVYTVYISNPPQPTSVYCDMTTDGGGWLVFQRRRDGTVDFYRNWTEYKNGFGYPGGEYWLGNEALHWLTAANDGRSYELRIDLADFNGTTRYAKYTEFKIASSSLNYKMISLGAYTGTAGDSLTIHEGAEFSTLDQNNDGGNCAVTYKGAWWYKACHSSNLNGLYLGGPHTSYADGVEWSAWTGYYYSLKISEMKIRPISE